jgi:dihydroorotate dehydrogenase (fumarate)
MEHEAPHTAVRPVDLSTPYLGLHLRNPIVASPSPLTGTIDGISRLVAAGVGAVVLPSILEEQVWNEAARRLERMPDGIGRLDRVASRRPRPSAALDDANDGLDLIRRARAEFDVPVIASLNGGDAGGWPAYAHALQQAGASAIELNIYEIPAEAGRSGRAAEDRHVEILKIVKSVVTIPVAVKLAPWLSAPGELAARLVEAGADGLVLFNRFLQPDIDLDRLSVVPRLELSTSVESRLPMMWIALLRGRLPVSLAATTGVADATDVVKYLLAGADVVMTASAVLRHGPAYAAELVGGLESWLADNGYATVDEVRGLLRAALGEDAAAKRAAYVDVLRSGRELYG